MTFKYFFTPLDLIPKNTMPWKMYGAAHLGILFLMVLFLYFMCRLYKNLDEIGREKFLKFFAYLILIQEIVKDIIFYFMGTLNYEHLPLHLCGASIFIVSYYAFKRTYLSKQMLYALVLPGALAALIFPNWVDFPLLHVSCFNSFTIHLWLVVVPIVSLYTKELVPDFRCLHKCFLFLVCLGVPDYFLNKRWGTDFLFLNEPSKGSPLMIIADIFGMDFYIVGMCVALFIVWALMYLPFYIKEKYESRESA